MYLRALNTRPRYITNVDMRTQAKHPLERWRLSAGIETKVAAATQLGMLPQQYCDIVAGRTEPSAARMRQIIEATDGQVTADDLVGWKVAS